MTLESEKRKRVEKEKEEWRSKDYANRIYGSAE